MHRDTFLFEELKKGSNKALSSIYKMYKSDFIRYARKFNLSDEEVVDVYQDAILALRENVVTGKLNILNSTLKTYFFSIGKYMIYDCLRKKNNIDFKELKELEVNYKSEEFNFLFTKELSEKQKKLSIAFQKLGDKCKRLLTLFYYQEYTLEEIVNELNYKTKDVVKSQKSRCLKTLKDKMK